MLLVTSVVLFTITTIFSGLCFAVVLYDIIHHQTIVQDTILFTLFGIATGLLIKPQVELIQFILDEYFS